MTKSYQLSGYSIGNDSEHSNLNIIYAENLQFRVGFTGVVGYLSDTIAERPTNQSFRPIRVNHFVSRPQIFSSFDINPQYHFEVKILIFFELFSCFKKLSNRKFEGRITRKKLRNSNLRMNENHLLG